MGTNGIKRDNLGMHGVINVLLWYCQEIKGEALIKCLLFFIMFGGDGKWDDRKTEDICR